MRIRARVGIAAALVLAAAPAVRAEGGTARRRAVVLEAVRGDGIDASARATLHASLTKYLGAQGLTVVRADRPARWRLQPTVVLLRVDRERGGVDVEVEASVVALDMRGAVSAMVKGGARTGDAVPGAQSASLLSQALDAAARSIAEDLGRRLREMP